MYPPPISSGSLTEYSEALIFFNVSSEMLKAPTMVLLVQFRSPGLLEGLPSVSLSQAASTAGDGGPLYGDLISYDELKRHVS